MKNSEEKYPTNSKIVKNPIGVPTSSSGGWLGFPVANAWVTWPERRGLEGAKDEVKEAKSAKRKPEVLQTRSWGPESL